MAVSLLAPAAAAQTPASLAGDYVHSQVELVAGIRLNADGTFQYGLTVGSLDERAQGRWKRSGDAIELTSDPRPVAPTVTAGAIEETPGKAFAVRLVAPNGSDVPGVDVTIAFDTGELLTDYTRGEAWHLPPEERRTPRSITFAKPSYRLQSEPLPLDAKPGRTATFLLIPNDFGVADLTGTRLEVEGTTLTLHREGGTMRFKRIED
ncbi:hypothetical protein [Sphingomonas jeddahensis]|uniref:hypothetical protein n=1 Tax=Sphingomonas jeddahensis TaxID=1915074 RepID=UPI001E621A7A|nr:hypothetical protein [Sphingomonas jeddahensis]